MTKIDKDQGVPAAMTSTPGQQNPDDPPAIDGVPRLSADLDSLRDELSRQARDVRDQALARLAGQRDKLNQLSGELDAAQARLAELAADTGKPARRRCLLRFWT